MKDLVKYNLSICIASYNRPELLKETLDSIGKLEASLDVHIIDDKSPRQDEISKVVEQWADGYAGRVDYNRNETNLGEVETKRLLFNRVESQYLMLLGDDDTLVKINFDKYIQLMCVNEECFDLELFGYNVIDQNNNVLKTRRSLLKMHSYSMNDTVRKYFMRYVTFPFYYFHPALYIIKTAVAKKLDLDPTVGIGEDYDLFTRIMNSTHVKWRINPIVLFNWRKHNKESINQSANVKKRFETKYLIIKKHDNLKLNRFWILYVPLWFDEGYSLNSKDLEDLGFSKSQIYLVSNNFLKWAKLLILPFYSTYRLFEYAFVQLNFLFCGRNYSSRF